MDQEEGSEDSWPVRIPTLDSVPNLTRRLKLDKKCMVAGML